MVECLINRGLDALSSHIIVEIEDRPAIRIGMQCIGGRPEMRVHTNAVVIQIRVRGQAITVGSHLAVNHAPGPDVLIRLCTGAVRVRSLQSLQCCRLDIIYGNCGVDATLFTWPPRTHIGTDEIGTGIEIMIDCGIAHRPGQNLV